MSYLDQDDGLTRNTTAYFETRDAAEKAVDDLVAAGIPRERISIAGTGVSDSAATLGDRSFWDELKDFFLPAEDRYAYAEGLRRGGFMVYVRSATSDDARVLEILDRDGAVDLDKEETRWRQEGWTGYPGPDSAAISSAQTDLGAIYSQTDDLPRAPAAASRMEGAVASGTEEVVPVYEEQLHVGKRDVSHGRVRIRSYVVETPVSEQVSLRNETVQVERNPVNRPVAAGDAIFQDRVIEAEERAEEAVVAKDVRVKEELTLRRRTEDRTQDVRDTVRRTEVEIQDGRGTTGAGRATAGLGGQIAEHMDVIASDGVKIGIVDHLEGPDTIKLAKSASPDSQHHYIPLDWVDHVDTHVHLTKMSSAAKAGW